MRYTREDSLWEGCCRQLRVSEVTLRADSVEKVGVSPPGLHSNGGRLSSTAQRSAQRVTCLHSARNQAIICIHPARSASMHSRPIAPLPAANAIGSNQQKKKVALANANATATASYCQTSPVLIPRAMTLRPTEQSRKSEIGLIIVVAGRHHSPEDRIWFRSVMLLPGSYSLRRSKSER
jgi:hypothetical protein